MTESSNITIETAYYRYVKSKTWQLAEGSVPIDAEGFDEFDLFAFNFKGLYFVFDAISGRKLLEKGFKSPEAAKKGITKYLKKVGNANFLDGIKKSISEHGISPRYSNLLLDKLMKTKVKKDGQFGFLNLDN